MTSGSFECNSDLSFGGLPTFLVGFTLAYTSYDSLSSTSSYFSPFLDFSPEVLSLHTCSFDKNWVSSESYLGL